MPTKYMLICCVCFCCILNQDEVVNGQSWQAAFATADITPTEPLRLGGYAVRDTPFEGVADPLSLRVMVLKHSQARNVAAAQDDPSPLVLVSIDAIAVPGAMTVDIAQWLQAQHAIPRSHLVVCCTHAHTAPYLPGSIDNILRNELSTDQMTASQAYVARITHVAKESIADALSRLQPAVVQIGQAEADFGVNRRVIKEGRWVNFGVQTDGLVDPRVSVIRVSSPSGELLGAAYQYACHCTTMGPEFNQISGDWAGLSAAALHQQHPQAVFVPIAGCGADINPNPRGGYEFAQQHAQSMTTAVESVLKQTELTELPAPSNAQFGFAGLEPELPTATRLDEQMKSSNVNEQRWAQHMIDIRQAMGRLPESVPMPIHVWSFGDALSWVFLSGEPVVEYQYVLENEFATAATWVAGYSDDLFAYVASQKQRSEGGYEVDGSMIYFLQPGRWKSGTQSLVMSRTSEIGKQARGEDEPLDAQQGLRSMHVPPGYQVELMSSEPAIQDPVNIAFDLDGSVWVVEMSDYPLGVEGGGRVKRLRDTDGDGRLDETVTFLEGLSYPTSVQPWRDGVIVIAAPDIFWARDTNGDGVADVREVLLSGVDEANPQHRGSGFEIGLDGRLHLASGHGTKALHSHRNGRDYQVDQHDIAWNPDTGDIEVFVNADTQFTTGRDSFGNWFGNNNYQPIYQYVFEAAELSGQSVDTGSVNHLLTPGDAPPVFPRSRTVDRFNDMYTRDRYTSACSSIIVRVPGLFADGHQSDSSHPIGLICEPVHNLVARVQLKPQGSVFAADRHPEDAQFDFLASDDPWSRLVRVVNAPDGTIWALDMYRRVIEHPQWIPLAWQQRIDIRGGAGLGRIYRVYHDSFAPAALADLRNQDPMQLLQSPIGPLRDLATLGIFTNQFPSTSDDDLQSRLRQLVARAGTAPAVTASALGILAGKRWLQSSDLATVLQIASDPQLIRWTLKLARRQESADAQLKQAVNQLLTRDLGPAVDLQWLLTANAWPDFSASEGVATILAKGHGDRWISSALNLLNSADSAAQILEALLSAADQNSSTAADLQEQLPTAKRLLRLMPVGERETFSLSRLPRKSTDLWSASKVLLLVASHNAVESETGKQALRIAIELAVERLLSEAVDSGDNGTAAKNLSLVVGSQLLDRDHELAVLSKLITSGNETAAQIAISRARFVGAPKLAAEILSVWDQLSPAIRQQAAAVLLTRPAWTTPFVAALEQGQVESNQLPAAVVQTLISYGDRNLRARAIAVLGQPSPRQSIVSEYLKRMPNPQTAGDVTRGEAAFRQHCAVCHLSQDGRPSIGPAVTNLAHWNNEQWITAVIDPNQAIEDKFKQVTLLTVDQEVVSGLIVDTSDTSLRIVSSDGSRREIALADIEQRQQSNTSLMPEGFESKLTPANLADIIKYLKTQP